MVNNESWLAHSDLFKKYWVVETKPWVRSLGWFTDYMETVKDADGWAQAGEKELTVFDYVQIVEFPFGRKETISLYKRSYMGAYILSCRICCS